MSCDHYLAGNALQRRDIGYDEAATLAMLQDIRNLFTPERVSALQGFGQRSDVPIFVLGVPRSGTTLVEQILANHPQVFGAGELELLRRLVARRGDRSGVEVDTADLSAASVRRVGTEYLACLRRLARGRSASPIRCRRTSPSSALSIWPCRTLASST
jgi:Sulfotransferase family